MYGRYIKAHDPEITVYGKACPLFVPLVEEGWLEGSCDGGGRAALFEGAAGKGY